MTLLEMGLLNITPRINSEIGALIYFTVDTAQI